MRLSELVVSAVIFGLSAAAGLQLTTLAQASQQRLSNHSELLARIEQDRLQLQRHWQEGARVASADCKVSNLQLASRAAALPLPAPLQRQLIISDDDQSLLVSWSSPGQAQPLRRRLFSPAGLGLCGDGSTAGATP